MSDVGSSGQNERVRTERTDKLIKKGNLLFLSSLAYSVNLINNTSILNKSEKIRPCGLLILSAEQTTF